MTAVTAMYHSLNLTLKVCRILPYFSAFLVLWTVINFLQEVLVTQVLQYQTYSSCRGLWAASDECNIIFCPLFANYKTLGVAPSSKYSDYLQQAFLCFGGVNFDTLA